MKEYYLKVDDFELTRLRSINIKVTYIANCQNHVGYPDKKIISVW